MLWEKYEYQFPRLSPYRFCCIFPCCGNLWGNPCISHMMTLVNFFLILTIVIALFRVQYNKYYPSSSYFSNKTKYEKKRKYWPSLARCSFQFIVWTSWNAREQINGCCVEDLTFLGQVPSSLLQNEALNLSNQPLYPVHTLEAGRTTT